MNPYIDDRTGAHFNKLGISDPAQLRQVEYALTEFRVIQLRLAPVQGNFDLEHLKQIHHHIFKDLYEWAGKERTFNFSKGDPDNPGWRTRFARHEDIQTLGRSVAQDVANWNGFKGLKKEDFALALSAVYIKLNAQHPFVEGNGRSTQAMLAQLARQAGYNLDFSKIDPHEWNRAAARSMPQYKVKEPLLVRPPDTLPIQKVFSQIVEPIQSRPKPEPGRFR